MSPRARGRRARRREETFVPSVGAAVPGAVRPMPGRHVFGPGRDRSFRLAQYVVDLGGQRTAFFDEGEGRPVIFLHGLAGNLTHWVNVAPRLTGRCRTIGIDLPGCGESEGRDEDLSIARYAQRVLGVMDALELPRATLVGHSLGGMVATTLALREPGRVDGIVAINPAGFQPLPLPVRLAGHAILRPRLLDRVLVRTWKQVLGQVFRRDNEYTRAFVRSVRDTYEDSDIHLLTRVISHLRHDYLDWDFGPKARELMVPVSMIWGRDDRLVPARALRKAAARLANVTTTEIPRCGHMPIIEAPGEVLAALEGALGLPRW